MTLDHLLSSLNIASPVSAASSGGEYFAQIADAFGDDGDDGRPSMVRRGKTPPKFRKTRSKLAMKKVAKKKKPRRFFDLFGDALDITQSQLGDSSSSSRIKTLAASIKTVGQARAALGAVANMVHASYDALDRVTGAAGLRDDARRLIEGTNSYATKIYASLPTAAANQKDPISTLTASKIGLCLDQAADNLKSVEAVTGPFIDFEALLAEVTESPGVAARWGLNQLFAGIGLPKWAVPVASVTVLGGLGFWAYNTFLRPITARR